MLRVLVRLSVLADPVALLYCMNSVCVCVCCIVLPSVLAILVIQELCIPIFKYRTNLIECTECPFCAEHDIIAAPFETKSDSFYFVEGKLVMHNKAEYAYNAGL